MFADHGMRWERDGATWPNHDASRFVTAGGLDWHVQVAGDGPPVLLLHGTAASTHSWAGLVPLLAERFRVVAPDLPGHGFTGSMPAHRLSLPGMSKALRSLLDALDLSPEVAVGHSAGAAIATRMTLDGQLAPRQLVSINGAFLPFGGIAGQLFPPIAKMLFCNPFVPHVFAWSVGDGRRVERMIRDTGSDIDNAGTGLYARLWRDPKHVAGALGMMANWELEPLVRDLPNLTTPLLLVVGAKDGTVTPSVADYVADAAPGAAAHRIAGYGHLVHEERPDLVAGLILDAARRAGVVDAA